MYCTSGKHPVVVLVVLVAATVTCTIANVAAITVDVTLHPLSPVHASRDHGHPSEARTFLRGAHTHHAQIPSLGSTWIGGVALFGRAMLEPREAQRLENEDVDTLLSTSENGSENEKVQFLVVVPAPV